MKTHPRTDCLHRGFYSYMAGPRCNADQEPCGADDPRPCRHCDRMEKTKERDRFCPECFSSGHYVTVFVDRDKPRGIHECPQCGAVWSDLLDYLSHKADLLGDLRADSDYELGLERAKRMGAALDFVAHDPVAAQCIKEAARQEGGQP